MTRILIVDDNMLEKIAINGMFSQFQFESDMVANGNEAILLIQNRI